MGDATNELNKRHQQQAHFVLFCQILSIVREEKNVKLNNLSISKSDAHNFLH